MQTNISKTKNIIMLKKRFMQTEKIVDFYSPDVGKFQMMSVSQLVFILQSYILWM